MLLFPFSNEEVFQSGDLLNFFAGMALIPNKACKKGRTAFFGKKLVNKIK